ncbi:hypothetical protein ACP_2394 [Acidobacterium capsulatum ATCC 51196]|uniref:Uncharacterized protein n=1 Tax=Acidobacterium capsulatum (strain ATCC 51196 / DSM 11244 / BCRC 80197 / JCM 7670 / NBRC 15755 / NCIMB 13165 / 161) TaxID=240015 RepID=C1F190_ACIC5|nr:hypothetical protein ACP_2394 [Acidobacterium capsulatum ATCC 51196]
MRINANLHSHFPRARTSPPDQNSKFAAQSKGLSGSLAEKPFYFQSAART